MDKKSLALFGGEPISTKLWPFYNTISDRERELVGQVLDSGVLSGFHASPGPAFEGGEMVRRLEADWKAHFGCRYAVSVNSATSALHAALVACGAGKGHEVILPQLGMSAAAAVVLEVGATPVFADCDPISMLIDTDSALSRISSNTRVIMPVHLGGQAAPVAPLMDAARQNGFLVVEDNAQAPGATQNGEFAGILGHIGCFSLNCHKIIQCGEGGIACTNDPDLAIRLKLFRNHGEKCSTGLGIGSVFDWGLNLRMTELQAAIAIAQLEKLDDLNGATVRRCEYVAERLDLPGITPPRPLSGNTHVYYIFHWDYDPNVVGVPAAFFAEAVQAEGFPVYAHYGYLMSYLPPFEDGQNRAGEEEFDDSRYPGACKAIRNSLWTMFIRPHITYSDLDGLIAAIQKVYVLKDRLRAI